MQPAGTEDAGREAELLPPVVEERAVEHLRRPRIHLAGDLPGNPQEAFVAGDGELEVALVVQGHRPDLPERILTVEHPSIGP